VLGSVGQQRHLTSLFDGPAQQALMLGTCPGLTTGFNLAAIRDEPLHEAVRLFVVDLADVIVAKLANFAAGRALTSTAFAPVAARP
jgi:hypothetical protein